MPLTVDALPFDALFNIAAWLFIEDFVHLGRTNRQLRSLLSEETACRRAVETHISHTKESLLAQKGVITYHRALQRVYSRREAFSTATPFSASVLAYGATFAYKQGVLSYLHDGNIRILHVHDAAKKEHIISIQSLLAQAGQATIELQYGTVVLLNYSDNILIVLCESQFSDEESWLLAINVEADTPLSKRVLVTRSLQTSAKIFARHDKAYLYYGTHSGIGSHGHHEWVITGVPLNGLPDQCLETVQLENFVGSDIGLTIFFEIHDGFFYALSNQTSFEVEEVDWTSYYNCVRFPVDRPSQIFLQRQQIWRRNHVEGPINDSWADLGLYIDETTGKLMIIEARREWQGGGSTSQRTYYTEPVNFPDPPSPDELPLDTPTALSSSNIDSFTSSEFLFGLPMNDPLVGTITSENKPHYEPPHIRLDKYTHPDDDDEFSSAAPSFILAKTKVRAYNPSGTAFLDLVDDPLPPSAATKSRLRQRLRLRIGSRKRASPDYEDADSDGHRLLKRPKIDPEINERIAGSEERFINRGVHMWPPDNAPPELFDILNPIPCASSEVTGVADERSLIYMTGTSSSPQRRAIVLINFDPTIRFPRLQKLSSDIEPSAYNPGSARDRVVGVELDGRRVGGEKCDGKGKKVISGVNGSLDARGGVKNWFWSEEAMYLRLGKGVRTR
ncbi:MAG: hypothetical protein M1835_001761 [Candelina submexicana]|nr:MAG: hypothetical protein M1835_001761 [Candelina submexicana]